MVDRYRVLAERVWTTDEALYAKLPFVLSLLRGDDNGADGGDASAAVPPPPPPPEFVFWMDLDSVFTNFSRPLEALLLRARPPSRPRPSAPPRDDDDATAEDDDDDDEYEYTVDELRAERDGAAAADGRPRGEGGRGSAAAPPPPRAPPEFVFAGDGRRAPPEFVFAGDERSLLNAGHFLVANTPWAVALLARAADAARDPQRMCGPMHDQVARAARLLSGGGSISRARCVSTTRAPPRRLSGGGPPSGRETVALCMIAHCAFLRAPYIRTRSFSR